MSLKILMISSSSNNIRNHYYPIDSPQELINEISEISNRMKPILYKGIVETNRNKFTYQHYITKEKNEEAEDLEAQDHPIIIICSDKLYKDNIIEKVFKEIFDYLNEINQKDSNISNEGKTKIAKIFLKYKNINDIKEKESNETEFGVLEEITGFDMKSRTSSYCEPSDIMNMDAKKRSRLRNLEKRRKEEIEYIKRWKKVKCIYLFISIILLMATIFSIFTFRKELF